MMESEKSGVKERGKRQKIEKKGWENKESR